MIQIGLLDLQAMVTIAASDAVFRQHLEDIWSFHCCLRAQSEPLEADHRGHVNSGHGASFGQSFVERRSTVLPVRDAFLSG